MSQCAIMGLWVLGIIFSIPVIYCTYHAFTKLSNSIKNKIKSIHSEKTKKGLEGILSPFDRIPSPAYVFALIAFFIFVGIRITPEPTKPCGPKSQAILNTTLEVIETIPFVPENAYALEDCGCNKTPADSLVTQ